MEKLAIIGLDCADPILLGEMLPELPTLRRLTEEGSFGRLRSIDPPITIPAWMCMMTGKDPGQLGVYGFRNRKDHSYDGLGIASSASFRAEPIWDTLAAHGRTSILLGVPGTFPPRPIRGNLVAGFLAPNTDAEYTFPASLANEIKDWVGDYMFDVRGFHTDDKQWLIDQVREMTQKRFTVARHLVEQKPWDFFAMVAIGPDRIHHGLWALHDKTHPKHDPASPFVDALVDYYRLVDREIASFLDCLPGGTRVLVVSDHGVQPMEGGIGINEWLMREGYLTLHGEPAEGARMQDLIKEGLIDWSKTQAWGEGGYYGRLFLNVAGREPEGIIPPENVETVRGELINKLEAIADENGQPIGTRVHRPCDLYEHVEGIPPDLVVYFGDLTWRSIGTLGWNQIHFHEHDTGPDDANHAPNGIYISHPADDVAADRSIREIRGIVLDHFGIATT